LIFRVFGLEDFEHGRGIFLVLLWDFSGSFVGFFWFFCGIFLVELEDRVKSVSDADGKIFKLELDTNSCYLCILQHISQYNYGP